jgi:hypothetical protein
MFGPYWLLAARNGARHRVGTACLCEGPILALKFHRDGFEPFEVETGPVRLFGDTDQPLAEGTDRTMIFVQRNERWRSRRLRVVLVRGRDRSVVQPD